MNNFIGCFYYKRTVNGNLLGEFINSKNPNVIAECAIIEIIDEKGFTGKFLSTWIEGGKKKIFKLEICLDINKFNLTWKNSKSEIEFQGIGFLVDDILIGSYWFKKS